MARDLDSIARRLMAGEITDDQGMMELFQLSPEWFFEVAHDYVHWGGI